MYNIVFLLSTFSSVSLQIKKRDMCFICSVILGHVCKWNNSIIVLLFSRGYGFMTCISASTCFVNCCFCFWFLNLRVRFVLPGTIAHFVLEKQYSDWQSPNKPIEIIKIVKIFVTSHKNLVYIGLFSWAGIRPKVYG